ncbi:SMP-30/gluconolactonase/LRE family protein [Ideonella sp. B508-1]|uniref:SMP-30/gluconolactonase/LRE family protein n=1 Tax=Ideonella sp. B508-1 TaxID=137716 RepID=UPI0004761D85|nr:SMP-30/gluconolactonase/LRE family protein [Ideonella sp. B508-1]
MSLSTALRFPAHEAPECRVPAEALLGEGLLWSMAEQALYWVDILGGHLHRYQPVTQRSERWSFGEPISAVTERAGGPGLLVALRSGLAFFDPALGPEALQRLCHPEPDLPGNRYNDGKCDRQGRFWVGSMDFDCVAPTGSLYRVDPDGRHSRHAQGIAVVNGPTWTLDGRTLLLNDSVQGCVYAHAFDPDTGTLGERRLWLRLPASDGCPDGMCTDAEGRIWIAHWGGGCVSCHDPDSAEELGRIHLPARQVSNCTFGGADLDTLFISTARVGLTQEQLAVQALAGSVFAVRTSARGQVASLFRG